MKKFNTIIILLFVLLLPGISNGDGGGVTGELIFHPINLDTQSFSITVTTDEYCWTWDKINQKTVFQEDYYFQMSEITSQVAFDEPKDVNNATLGTIPWGKMNFTVHSTGGHNFSFTIDLRDENWSQNTSIYWTHDTYVNINFQPNGLIFLSQGTAKDVYDHNDPQQLLLNNDVEIWSFWHPNSTPDQYEFKVPVTLHNYVEGSQDNFGYLLAEGLEITSGQPAFFRKNVIRSVEHGTLEHYTNVRNYSYKWDYSDWVSPIANQNIYYSNFDFSVTDIVFDKSIIRNFKTVWPLTIKNNLVEAGGISDGYILFKDPTTDNQFHQYPAENDGFVKNEAFKELNENIPGYGFSKYSVKAISTVSYGGRNYYWFGGDFNPSSQTDLTITEATTLTANYKGTQLSDDANAYKNNSQRKFVRTDDGVLHHVYESLGRVWYETSTNNGNSWIIANNGQPLDNGEGKQPSIDYSHWTVNNTDYYDVFIVFQEKYGNDSKIEIKYFWSIDGYGPYQLRYQGDVTAISGTYASTSATPVVGSYMGNFTVVWKNGTTGSLYACGGLVNVSNIIIYSAHSLTGTGSNSKSPTISFYNWITKLAWEEENASGSSIKYAALSGSQISGTILTPSENNGFSENFSPSIVVLETDNIARLCWVASRYVCAGGGGVGDCVQIQEYKILFKGLNNLTRQWVFGTSGYAVSSPNISKKNNNAIDPYYAFAWSESSGENKFADNTLSTVRTLNTVGQNLQIANGPDKNNMYAMSFDHNSGIPYYFKMSYSLGSFYIPQKIQLSSFHSGREGVVSIDSADFYFALGDITVDNQPADFVEIADTIPINNLSTLNEYLISEPISVTDNSSFVYSVQYGINDSLSAVQALAGNEFVSFKVQLVDANTEEIIGEYDNITYNEENIFEYGNISYEVNTQGIGNRTVRLKLVVDDNINSAYSMSKIYSDESVLEKSNVKEINYNGNESITSYDLFQNYPNPFNPSTTIKYQIPKSGNVTIKVFDILGAEVATLVSEFQNEGRYEVNFDASNLPAGRQGLASGVYIYRLTAGEFIQSMKMLLLK